MGIILLKIKLNKNQMVKGKKKCPRKLYALTGWQAPQTPLTRVSRAMFSMPNNNGSLCSLASRRKGAWWRIFQVTSLDKYYPCQTKL